jgi:cytoplasmic iron level regulating protein YaaA (DUF328/UPF0246 family)
MLILLSPAKNLNYESPFPEVKASTPRLLDDSCELVNTLKALSPDEIGKLMKLSPALSELNANRYQKWSVPMSKIESRPSIFAFNGDVYAGLDAYQLDNDSLERVQSNIRILSGLYGLLRPFDNVLPYRLEMGTKLVNARGKNLYQFWGERITHLLQQDLLAQRTSAKAEGAPSLLVNLASNEYAKSVDFSALKAQKIEVVHPVFKDQKQGEYKVISFYAKKARGMMARFLCATAQPTLDYLLTFNLAGYQYDPLLSTKEKPTFIRGEMS